MGMRGSAPRSQFLQIDSALENRPCKAAAISDSLEGSSMVAGMVQASPWAIFFIVLRKILPGPRLRQDGSPQWRF
jgi:hypothetical protein